MHGLSKFGQLSNTQSQLTGCGVEGTHPLILCCLFHHVDGTSCPVCGSPGGKAEWAKEAWQIFVSYCRDLEGKAAEAGEEAWPRGRTILTFTPCWI